MCCLLTCLPLPALAPSGWGGGGGGGRVRDWYRDGGRVRDWHPGGRVGTQGLAPGGGAEGGVGKVQESPRSLVSVVIKAGRLLAVPSCLCCCVVLSVVSVLPPLYSQTLRQRYTQGTNSGYWSFVV